MKKIVIKDFTRLDTVVYSEYKTLDVLTQVIEVNPQLKHKAILHKDDVIYLPNIPKPKKQIEKSKALW